MRDDGVVFKKWWERALVRQWGTERSYAYDSRMLSPLLHHGCSV